MCTVINQSFGRRTFPVLPPRSKTSIRDILQEKHSSQRAGILSPKCDVRAAYVRSAAERSNFHC